jgi:hypothetical protein
MCSYNSDKISSIGGQIECGKGHHLTKICGIKTKSNTCVDKCEEDRAGASLSPYLGSYKNDTSLISLITNYQNVFGTSKMYDVKCNLFTLGCSDRVAG